MMNINRLLTVSLAAICLVTCLATAVQANMLVTYGTNSAGLFRNDGTLILNYATNLSNPQDITTDGTYVYVADYGGQAIRKYDAYTGAPQANVMSGLGINPIGLAWTGSVLGSFSANFGSNFAELTTWNVNATNSAVASTTNYGLGYEDLIYIPRASAFAASIYDGPGAGLIQFFGTNTAHIFTLPNTGSSVTGLADDGANIYFNQPTPGIGATGVGIISNPPLVINPAFATAGNFPIGIAFDSVNNQLGVASFSGSAILRYNLSGNLLGSVGITNPAFLEFTALVPEPNSAMLLLIGGSFWFRAVSRRKRQA